MVLAVALLDHAEADHRLAIAAEHETVFDHATFDPRHIAQAHQIAVLAARQHQFGEVFGLLEIALDARLEDALVGLQRARGQLDVLGAQRAFHVAHAQAARGQRLAVEPHPHGVTLAAADTHPRDAVERRILVGEIALGVVGQLRHAHAVARQVLPDDHVVVAVDLLHLGRIGLLGQVVLHPGDAVAHIVGGLVDIAVDGELDGHPRGAVA